MLASSPREGAAVQPRRRPCLLLLVLALAGLAAGSNGSTGAGTGASPGGEAPALGPGDTLERTIAAGEVHSFRATVAGAPLLVIVEQRGIDLVVVDRPAAGGKPVQVDAPNRRWGAEVLLLETAGEHRVEVGSLDAAAAAGAYSLRLELLAGDGPDGARRRAAAAAMTRATRKPAAWTFEALRSSLAAYREALEGWHALGDRPLEAEARFAIARREDSLGERGAAAADFERTLAIWQDLGESRREADTLDWLGLVRLELGESESARAAIADSLALWRRLGERLEEGATLADAGFVEHSSGALPAALAPYQQALALLREVGARGEEARVLNNLGGLHDLLGEPEAALDRYREALVLRRELGDRPGEAQTLNNIAVIDRLLGDWQAALDAYGQVLAMLAPLHLPDQKAAALNNLASLYSSVGEPERALPLFEESLALHRAVSDRRSEVVARNNLSVVRRALGELDRALGEHRQALALAAELGDPSLQAVSRLHVAQDRIEQGDAGAAADLEAAQALLAQTGSRRPVAGAFHLQGRALALAGRPEAALAALRQALDLRRALHDRAGEAETLDELAAVERRLGRREEARGHAEAAVSVVEGLRSGLASLGLRASFVAARHRAYELLIDLLMDRHLAEPAAGFDRTALEVSERARARSLLDLLYERGPGRLEGIPADLLARRRALVYRLSARTDRQEELARGAASAKAEAALAGEIESLLAQLDGVESEIRRRASGDGAAGDLPPLGAEEIPRLLDPGTVLLEFALGEERSYAWAVGERGIHSAVLPARGEIERQARQLHLAWSAVETGSRLAIGDALGRLLLEPPWTEVARAGRLVLVPDAALNLVPWGALRVPRPGHGWSSGERVPLVELKEVVEIPSATTLALERRRLEGRPAAARRAAVFADPVFAADDPRVASARHSRLPVPAGSARDAGALASAFERLPATRREAAAIAGLAPAGEVFAALDFAANREAVLSGELRRYRIVHFATHTVVDTRHPELSGLVLSQVDAGGRPRGGFVRLPDLYELDLAAHLVVLSGCRTAIGKPLRGEGLMGLTRGFEAAGVPRVVGSLWRVEDRATAKLMTRFYRAMWLEAASPSAALRAAQRAVRSDRHYRDPHFWAGFVHQGDWRPVR
jgi:CHAT domain-containing protein/tetratricopeptide (TPR) repeat protein